MTKEKKTLTTREKQAVVSLSRAGVNHHVIAKAFGIRPMSVAAYKAWDTMNGKG